MTKHNKTQDIDLLIELEASAGANAKDRTGLF